MAVIKADGGRNFKVACVQERGEVFQSVSNFHHDGVATIRGKLSCTENRKHEKVLHCVPLKEPYNYFLLIFLLPSFPYSALSNKVLFEHISIT